MDSIAETGKEKVAGEKGRDGRTQFNNSPPSTGSAAGATRNRGSLISVVTSVLRRRSPQVERNELQR
jgi:hypothetical protein